MSEVIDGQYVPSRVLVLRWKAHAWMWRLLRRVGIRPKSNLVEHARRELAIIGEDSETTKGLLRVVQAFADMGHSGGSASIAVPMIVRLLRFENLSPLTADPSEWMDVDGGTLWQSVRRPDAFSHDGGRTHYLLDDNPRVIYTTGGCCE